VQQESAIALDSGKDMTRAMLLLSTTMVLLVCGAPPAPTWTIPARGSGCSELSYSPQQVAFRCGAVTYDLLRTPVRSRRIFDIVSREAFTRRHFVTRRGGRRYVFQTVQLEGEPYPRVVLLETPRGFTRVLLDRQGNVVRSEAASDLSQ